MSHQAVHESEFSKNAVVKGQVLVVCTNADKLKDISTGLWLSELAEPYYMFKEAGYDVTLASPKGGGVPLDDTSLQGEAFTAEAARFKQDEEAMQQLQATVPLPSIQDPGSYDITFLPGGHGPMVDLAQDKGLGELLTRAYAAGKVVAAVCHGPAGLVLAQDGDQPLVAGKKVTGFSNSEEDATGKTKLVPFLLETRLRDLGGNYSAAGDWQPHVEVDGRLVTGQNPTSSKQVAQATLDLLKQAQQLPTSAGTGGLLSKEQQLANQQARELAPAAEV